MKYQVDIIDNVVFPFLSYYLTPASTNILM